MAFTVEFTITKADGSSEQKRFTSDAGFGEDVDAFYALKDAYYYLGQEFSEAVDKVQPTVDKGKQA